MPSLKVTMSNRGFIPTKEFLTAQFAMIRCHKRLTNLMYGWMGVPLI